MLSLPGRGGGLKETFQDIAEDLMNLEVNTIIQTSLMTARKAPRPAHALLDIVGEYRSMLLEDGYGLTSFRAVRATNENVEQWSAVAGEMEPARVDSGTFRALYVTARAGLGLMDRSESASEVQDPDREIKQAVLSRIRRSSLDIANVLDRLEARCQKDPAKSGWAYGKTRREILEHGTDNPDDHASDLIITNREWIMIRKVWEISVEQIAMQTVIQLDGDVVTRICRTYAGDEHHHLWSAHMDSTKVAMDSWQYLVETVGKFLKNAANLFRGS